MTKIINLQRSQLRKFCISGMKDQVIHMIRDGHTIKECASSLNISRNKLYRLMSQWKITKKKVQFNEDFFENIDGEPQAYWLGFLMADGCVSLTQSPKVQIKLHPQDEGHLIKWHESIGSCAKLSTINNKYKQSAHYSNKMCQDLIRHGCIPNKSLLLKFPNIPKELLNHFIRGYFDGDGCITFSNNRKISFVGTKEFLEELRGVLNAKGHFSVTGRAFDWGVHGNKITQRIIDYMYKNATIWLDRKKEKCHYAI